MVAGYIDVSYEPIVTGDNTSSRRKQTCMNNITDITGYKYSPVSYTAADDRNLVIIKQIKQIIASDIKGAKKLRMIQRIIEKC
jgi:hypothetical protein